MEQLLPCIQRVVFLIDLRPIFSSPNPNPSSYLTPILSSVRRILAAPQLASSLSALKFFFSSLSAVFSSSKTDRLIGRCSDSLSFDRHSQTLVSLQEILKLVSLRDDLSDEWVDGDAKASLIARSLLQMEQYVCDRKRSDAIEQDLVGFGSNLVILFSPVSQDANVLAQFVDFEVNCDKSVSFDDFSKNFSRIFSPVKERLDSKDIHLSWIGVDFEFGSEKDITNSNWIERVFKDHNWGFSSTDKIILGSSIVPIGLIFPYIGSSIGQLNAKRNKKGQIDLILEISDVSGNPLECKSCELELLDSKNLNQSSVKNKIDPLFNNSIQQISKIQVKGVQKAQDISYLVQNSLSLLIIHGLSSEIMENSERNNKELFFVDKILEFLCTEKGELVPNKPIWQLFLSFLYSKNYSALVLIPNMNGTFFEGILIPFTINHALIYILKNRSFITNDTIEIIKEKRRRKKGIIESLILSKDLNSIREIVLSKSESEVLADLFDFYFHNLNSNNKQKKLKFFKCWMSQVREIRTINCNENQIISEKENEKEIQKIQNNEEIQEREEAVKIEKNEINTTTTTTTTTTTNNNNNDEMEVPFGSVEEIDEFISNLGEKIESGLIADEGNLGILAETLVRILMLAIRQKNVENVPLEVSSLLLKKPKDLIAKYKGGSYDTNYKIKEHELQILFRMEILKSELSSKIEENWKQKTVKEICAFLEFIDINLQMDSSNSAPTLFHFAEKSLKSRYNDSLPSTIQQIYRELELEIPETESRFYSSHNSSSDNFPGTSNPAQLNPFDTEMLNARQKREINRRRSFITSFQPDLKKVWALKQPKLDKFGPKLKGNKLGKRKRGISSRIVVCETPMTGTERNVSTKERERGNSVCRSLSKALFCDDDESDSGLN
ncbi:hypothetical protein LUZ60_010071 [Juncus effusus]|nr:hypothetical protein LUZ60_010071 [Juncus effusus]